MGKKERLILDKASPIILQGLGESASRKTVTHLVELAKASIENNNNKDIAAQMVKSDLGKNLEFVKDHWVDIIVAVAMAMLEAKTK